MEKKVEFSVLMSVYKKENPDYLRVALDSVFNQTFKSNDVVLIEDGELTTELEEVITEYEKKYKELNVIRFKNNRGLGPALNDGIVRCKNNYVARVDTDDECEKNRFECQIKYLINNPEVDVVGCNMNEYDADLKNVISIKSVPEHHNDIKKYLKKRNPINHPTVMYKRDKVLEVKGYEDYKYFEDYYLWAKMMKNGCIFYNIQENLYKFRAGSSMFQRRGGIKYLRCISNFEKGLYDLKIINRFEQYCNLLSRFAISLCPNFVREGIYKKMLRRVK